MDLTTSPFTKIIERFPDMMIYAVAVPLVLIALFIGRLVLRSMVNKKVKAIGSGPIGFGHLEKLKSEGLISEEEFKLMRNRSAHRQLDEVKGQTEGISAQQILASVEADPNSALEFVGPMSEGARRSLAGLGQKFVENEDGEPVPAPGESSSAVGAQPRRQAGVSPPKAETVPPGHGRAAPAQPQRAASAPTAGKPTDIDLLLAKGLISKEEYNRLAALLKKAGQ